MTEQNLNQPLLTKKELADRLRVSVRTIDRGIKDGSIPHIKIGKTIRIHESVLQSYLNPETAAKVSVQEAEVNTHFR